MWVSTDNIDIAAETMRAGAPVHWRSDETATDTATSLVAVQEFASLHPGNSTKSLKNINILLFNIFVVCKISHKGAIYCSFSETYGWFII